MAVVTRRRSVRILVVVAAGFPLLLAGGAALLTVMIGQSCTGGGVGDAPSPVAVRDIPARMLAIYQQVGAPRYLGPGQLLKHALALNSHADGRPTHLVYCYWEPENGADFEGVVQHRVEVADLMQRVGDAEPLLHATTYAALFDEWSKASRPRLGRPARPGTPGTLRSPYLTLYREDGGGFDEGRVGCSDESERQLDFIRA